MEAIIKYRKLIYVITAFLVCVCFNSFFSVKTTDFTNNVLALLFFACGYLLQNAVFKRKMQLRKWICCGIGGAFFAICLSFGYSITKTSGVPYTSLTFLFSNLVYVYFFAILLYLIWDLIEKTDFSNIHFPLWLDYFLKKTWIKAVVFLLFWIPAYIGSFPGNFVYDSGNEYNQIINGFTADFPLIHSFLVTNVLSFSKDITGSAVCGIAVLTAAQAILLAFIFSYMITVFYRTGVNSVFLVLSILYIAFSPAIAILAVSLVRDVLFGALFTLCVTFLYEMVTKKNNFWKNGKYCIFGAVLAFALLSRNNSSELAFLIVLAAVCLLFFIFARNNRKKAAVMSLTALLIYCIIQGSLSAAYTPEKSSTNTTFSLPIQQVAKIAVSCDLSEEEQQKIDWIFPGGVKYYPGLSDPAKGAVSMETDEEWQHFWEIWKYFGKKYTGLYLTAFLESTVDFWFPNAIVDGYNQCVPSYKNYDKCWFYFETDKSGWGYEQNDLNKFFGKIYSKIGLFISFEKVPVLSMLFSIGFQLWMIVNTFLFVIYKRRYALLLPIGLLLFYCILTALTPIILMRYVCALFMCFPLVVSVLFNSGNQIKKTVE